MPNANHPLHDLDCETLTRTVDLLTRSTRDISDTWDRHQPQVLRERLAEVQDILTRAIDVTDIIANHGAGA